MELPALSPCQCALSASHQILRAQAAQQQMRPMELLDVPHVAIHTEQIANHDFAMCHQIFLIVVFFATFQSGYENFLPRLHASMICFECFNVNQRLTGMVLLLLRGNNAPTLLF
jgi:hypothetical protein